jgi:hypothetical protein
MLRTALLVLCVVACSKGKSDEELLAELTEQKPLELPLPTSTGEHLQMAPVIIVTKSEISYQGELMAQVDDVVRDTHALDTLARALNAAAVKITYDLVTGKTPPELVQACHDTVRNIRPMQGTMCPAGLAILQADQATDMRVVNAVVNTARAAGFDNLLFAVKSK